MVRDKRRKPSPRARPQEPGPGQDAAGESARGQAEERSAAAETGAGHRPSQPASDAGGEPGGRHTRAEADGKPGGGTFAAEVQALRAELDERTKDLQRLTAEFANYRRRVERDRALAGEQATATVLAELLGVLDDLDRARDHGDLVGPFGAVAEQLVSVLTKLGLSGFAEPGDQFDPSRHEAVAHSLSSDVDRPTCVQVFRRGYLFGERLLRPAMVAVADPADEEPVGGAPAAEPAAADTAADPPTAGAADAETGTADQGSADAEVDAETLEVDALEAEVIDGAVADPEAAAVVDAEESEAEPDADGDRHGPEERNAGSKEDG